MEMSDNKDVKDIKSKKDVFFARIKERYPDVDYDNEETVFETLNNDYDEKESRLAKYEEESAKLIDRMNEYPQLIGLLTGGDKNQNPITFIIENFGDDFKAALDSEEGRKMFEDSYQKYLDKVAAAEKLNKEADDNLKVSLETLEELQKEKGYTDAQCKDIFEFLIKIGEEALVNNYSKESFEFAAKALNYDKDIEDAAHTAEIKGRNTAISEKLKAETQPDVPPTSSGAGSSIEEQPAKRYNPFAANN